MRMYILTEAELKLLLQDQKCLNALEAYGVDNWDGYEEALNDEDFTVGDDDLTRYVRTSDWEVERRYITGKDAKPTE